MVYQWKAGTRFRVNPQVVGERLAELTAQNGGYISPGDVVDDARPPDAPLHSAFTWDDRAAAEKHRENEARQLIRCIRPVVRDAEGNERPTYGYFHVNLNDIGPRYVESVRALNDDDLREQVLADAVSGLESWRRRHENIGELGEVYQAIEQAAANLRRRQQRNRARRKRAQREQPADAR